MQEVVHSKTIGIVSLFARLDKSVVFNHKDPKTRFRMISGRETVRGSDEGESDPNGNKEISFRTISGFES